MILAGAVASRRRRTRTRSPFEAFNDAFGGSVHLAHQHEPARGQALVLRRRSFADRRARPAAVIIMRAGADRQDEGVAGRGGAGAYGRPCRTSPLTAAELAEAKDRLMKHARRPLGDERSGGLARWARSRRYGLPEDYYVTYADEVRKASDADVNAAAKKFVAPEPAGVGRDRRPRQDRGRHQGVEAR